MTSAARNGAVSTSDIMRRVREEVARRRSGQPMHIQAATAAGDAQTRGRASPLRLPPVSPPPLDRRGTYGLDELLAFHDRDFVRQAYAAILRRSPDGDGERHFLAKLRSGELSKIEVLGRLRYSAEGRSRRVRVTGLLMPFAAHHIARTPVVGYPLALTLGLIRLPRLSKAIQRLESHALRAEAALVEHLNRQQDALDGKADFASVEHAISEVVLEATASTSRLDQLAQRIDSTEQASHSANDGVDALQRAVSSLSEAVQRLTPMQVLEERLEQVAVRQRDAATRSELCGLQEALAATLSDLRAFQESVNAKLAQEACVLSERTAEIARKIETLSDDAQAIEDRLKGCIAAEVGEVRGHVSKARDDVSALRNELAAVRSHADAAYNEASAAQSEAAAVRSHADAAHNVAAAARSEVAAVRSHADAAYNEATAARSEAAAVRSHADAAYNEATAVRSEAAAVRSHADATRDELSAARSNLASLRQQVLDYRRTLLDTQRRVAMLIGEARKRMPAVLESDQMRAIAAESDHLLDAFYASFEDRFRGTREDIKRRASRYLPLIASAGVGIEESPIIDLGCGRGEWLEVLAENRLTAAGIDLNDVMIEQCRELGLVVDKADALAYLRSLRTASVGAVTAMHLIEHLPFGTLIELFDEALRVLRPNGLLIFETPNPENLQVGACYFYLDPTHRNPLPPPLVEFIADARGFVGVEVLRLSEDRGGQGCFEPMEATLPGANSVNAMVGSLNSWMFAPPDYAIVARKA